MTWSQQKEIEFCIILRTISFHEEILESDIKLIKNFNNEQKAFFLEVYYASFEICGYNKEKVKSFYSLYMDSIKHSTKFNITDVLSVFQNFSAVGNNISHSVKRCIDDESSFCPGTVVKRVAVEGANKSEAFGADVEIDDMPRNYESDIIGNNI